MIVDAMACRPNEKKPTTPTTEGATAKEYDLPVAKTDRDIPGIKPIRILWWRKKVNLASSSACCAETRKL